MNIFKIDNQQIILTLLERTRSYILVLNRPIVSPLDPFLSSSAQSDLQFSSPIFTEESHCVTFSSTLVDPEEEVKQIH